MFAFKPSQINNEYFLTSNFGLVYYHKPSAFTRNIFLELISTKGYDLLQLVWQQSLLGSEKVKAQALKEAPKLENVNSPFLIPIDKAK